MPWPSFTGALLLGDALDGAGYEGDFGALVERRPAAVLRAASVDDVVLAMQHARSAGLRVVPRGEGHTTRGQSLHAGALVVDLRGLATIGTPERGTVRVGAGARWSSVVRRTHALGLMPPVLTDYVELSIGGTLSVGGVGGQSFAHGLQVDNVVELEVVTGTGARLRCGPDRESELFHACLGGLGQLGIIVEATLRLVPAPQRVRVRTLPYDDVATFLDAQHTLATSGAFHYLVGNLLPPASPEPGARGWELGIECVCDANAAAPDPRILAATGARLDREQPAHDLGYLDYVQRLDAMVTAWQASGAWTAHHPWIDLFIAQRGAAELVADALDGLDRNGLGEGYVMTYPLRRSTHGAALPLLPAGEQSFLFDILPTVARGDLAGLAAMERRSERLLAHALGKGATVYPIGYPLGTTPSDATLGRRLLGERHDSLQALRRRHDPDGCCGSATGWLG